MAVYIGVSSELGRMAYSLCYVDKPGRDGSLQQVYLGLNERVAFERVKAALAWLDALENAQMSQEARKALSQ